MTTDQPLSLTEAQRRAPNTDTILLRATRPADLETPIGAFLRLDDGGPAYLLESVEGGERLGTIAGVMPGLRALPPGCRFHPRCPAAEPRCTVEAPVLRTLGASHRVACHLAGNGARPWPEEGRP